MVGMWSSGLARAGGRPRGALSAVAQVARAAGAQALVVPGCKLCGRPSWPRSVGACCRSLLRRAWDLWALLAVAPRSRGDASGHFVAQTKLGRIYRDGAQGTCKHMPIDGESAIGPRAPSYIRPGIWGTWHEAVQTPLGRPACRTIGA